MIAGREECLWSTASVTMTDQDQVRQEEEDRDKLGLTFNEVLHLLSKRAVLGAGIPSKYSAPPWRLPDSHPQSSTVNSLLETSIMVQSAHVPNTENDFQQFVLSNAR